MNLTGAPTPLVALGYTRAPDPSWIYSILRASMTERAARKAQDILRLSPTPVNRVAWLLRDRLAAEVDGDGETR